MKIINANIGFEEINTNINTDNIDVTVWCTAYNHANYIEKALKGFINQETTFNYEVIVFDDASTDGTQDIIREYASEYPKIIKAYLANVNTYRQPQARQIRTALKENTINGKYIALCEGDDYWIYSKKLQRQYNLLENNPDLGMCIHNAIRFDGKEIVPQIIDMDSQVLNDKEIFFSPNGLTPTASFFFRADVYWELIKTKGYQICPVGDNPIRFWFNYKSKVFYIDKCWSVRNFMHEGSWNKKFVEDKDYYIDYCKRNLEYYEVFDEETHGLFHTYLELMRKNLTYTYMAMDIKECSDTMTYIENMSNHRYSTYEKKYLMKHVIPILKDNQDYYDVISKIDKKKYIYGAGEEAIKLAKELNQRNINFEGFVVTSLESNPNILLGKEVQIIDRLDDYDELMFVLGMNARNKTEVIDKLYDRDILLV